MDWAKAEKTWIGQSRKKNRWPHHEGRPSAAPHHMVAGAFGARHHVVMHYVVTYWISIKNMKYFPSRSEATPFPERSDSISGAKRLESGGGRGGAVAPLVGSCSSGPRIIEMIKVLAFK